MEIFRRPLKAGATSDTRAGSGLVSADVKEILNSLDLASIIVAPGGALLFNTNEAVSLGVIRDGKIVSDELLNLLATARRKNKSQMKSIEVARGPIGEGSRKLSVKISTFGFAGALIALLIDESEAERIDAVRRDFVANISHELKTPISALRTLSDAVAAATEDPQLSKFAVMMQNEAERLSNLVQEIINLSRLQNVDPLLDAVAVDIDDVVEEAISQSQLIADSREIKLVRGPKISAIVDGDRKHLIMAVHNLIENAVNYSPSGTNVTINTESVNGIIEIDVIDQGIGIADSNTARIFERFYRVDPARSRETGGTGLGLSIVKHIALNHGGDVSVWSSEGVGSTFSLRLPLGENSPTESGASS